MPDVVCWNAKCVCTCFTLLIQPVNRISVVNDFGLRQFRLVASTWRSLWNNRFDRKKFPSDVDECKWTQNLIIESVTSNTLTPSRDPLPWGFIGNQLADGLVIKNRAQGQHKLRPCTDSAWPWLTEHFNGRWIFLPNQPYNSPRWQQGCAVGNSWPLM